MTRIHLQARTTPLVRAEIKASKESNAELARRYNISKATVRKWRLREEPVDRSHRPHKLSTTLNAGQEAIVVELRRLLLLPLDDLLVVTREFICKEASRSALDRCLRRHNVNDLRALRAQLNPQEPQNKPAKTFKDYEPGFVHIDIKYLPQMPDESQRRYLFVAIDRATRWVKIGIYNDQSDSSAIHFLEQVYQAAPMKIIKVLTDNGSQFTDRFTSKTKEPTGRHHFDVRCKALNIEHRLCPPRHPQTNGMVERFNGRVGEVIAQTRFKTGAELESTLLNYVRTYNHQIPQRALDHLTPIQSLKLWREKSPGLFHKRVHDLPGLDIRSNLLAPGPTTSPGTRLCLKSCKCLWWHLVKLYCSAILRPRSWTSTSPQMSSV